MGREGCVAGMIIARSCPGRAPLGEGEGRCHPTRCICTDSKHIKGVSDDIPQSQTHISREEIPFPAHHPNMPSFNATCYARFTHPPKEGGKSKNKKKKKRKGKKTPYQGSHLPSLHPVLHRSCHRLQSNCPLPNLTFTALCASHIQRPNSSRLLTRGAFPSSFIQARKSSAQTQHG